MKELIQTIARSLVDQPDKVTVNEIKGDQCTVLELNVEKSEIGKIIGKQGRTAQAIRTILSAVSAKSKRRTILEIVETNEAGGYARQKRTETIAISDRKSHKVEVRGLEVKRRISVHSGIS